MKTNEKLQVAIVAYECKLRSPEVGACFCFLLVSCFCEFERCSCDLQVQVTGALGLGWVAATFDFLVFHVFTCFRGETCICKLRGQFDHSKQT